MPDLRFTNRQMLELAARAVGRIDRDGVRGASLITMDQTIAMAGTLVALGLVPIPPGEAAPARLVTPSHQDT